MNKRIVDRNRSKFKRSDNFKKKDIRSSIPVYHRNITDSDDEIEDDNEPHYRKRPSHNLYNSRNRKLSESDIEREQNWISEAVDNLSRDIKDIKTSDEVEKPQSHRRYRRINRNEQTKDIKKDINRNTHHNHRDKNRIEKSNVKVKIEKSNVKVKERDRDIEIYRRSTSISTPQEKIIPHLKILLKNDQTNENESNTITPSSKNKFRYPEQFVSLIDGDMKFDSSSLDDLLNDENEYVVIGVLGMEKVGKSTILSNFVIPLPFQHNTKDIFLDNSNTNKDDIGFGLRVYVTLDRLILIDTQPLFSSSILTKLENNPCKSMAFAKTQLDLQSLSIAVFILTVCHIVLVVSTNSNPRMMRLIQTAAKIRKKLSSTTFLDSLSRDITSSSKFPEVIFIYNKIPMSFVNSDAISRFKNIITRNLANTDIRMNGSIVPCWTELDSDTDDKWQPNMYILLRYNDQMIIKTNDRKIDYDSTDTEHFSVIMNNLCNQIRAMPKMSWGVTQPTEREWLCYASRVWAEIGQSALIQECSQELHKSCLDK